MNRKLASAPPAAPPVRTTKAPSQAPATVSNTPQKVKVTSDLTKGPKQYEKKHMDSLLAQEIGQYPKDVPTHALLRFLFPDECLPASNASEKRSVSDIFEKLSTGDEPFYVDHKWVDCPELSKPSKRGDVERDLVAFLEKIGQRVAELTGDAPKRTWSARNATDVVEDAPNSRLPDLLLGTAVETIRWGGVDVHGELKSSAEGRNKKEVFRQLLNGAYLIFSSQDNRRFVVSLCFLAHTLQFYVFDRAGLVTSSSFDIHKKPKSFIHLITVLMFVDDPAFLGFDTSIVERDGGRFITVGPTEYQIVKTLFISDVIRGRGTVCWHARNGDKDVVIKDSWVDDSREHLEAEILRKAAGVRGVPKVVADAVVQTRGVVDSTDTLRSVVKSAKRTKRHKTAHTLKSLSNTETRIHRRLVITPLCSSLPNFANRRELLSIFIDIVNTHRNLYEKNRIVHRDISVNNIMIVPHSAMDVDESFSNVATPAAASGARRGLMIDFDYALVEDPEKGERKPAVGHRTGTLPFMAVEVLMLGGELPAHEPKHDLESMLYVLIWVCLHYAGPGNVERQNFDIHRSPELTRWIEGSFEAIATSKSGTMLTPLAWERHVLSHFAPYFHPLKTCITKWRDLYRFDNMKYDTVLEVLKAGLNMLPEEEKWSREDDPEGYGPETGQKRKRHDFLDHINVPEGERAAKSLNAGGGRRDVMSAPTPGAAAPANVNIASWGHQWSKYGNRRQGKEGAAPSVNTQEEAKKTVVDGNEDEESEDDGSEDDGSEYEETTDDD